MKKLFELLEVDLQLCAEGAGGAEGGTGTEGAPGATAAAAGQQNTGVQPGTAQQAEGAAAAGQQGEDPNKTFEQLIKGQYKDQYNSRVENTVKQRVKGLTQQLQRLQPLEGALPILDILAQKYGVDSSDIAGLAKAAQEDASFFAEEAIARGMDVKDLMAFKRMERDNAAMQRQLQQQRGEEQANRQLQLWMQQEEAVKQMYPGFDLNTELQNDGFKQLLLSGVPMRTAYMVVHNDEIMQGAMQFAAQKAAQQVTDTVIAGAARPAENGTGAQGAVSPKLDVSKLTDKQIKEFADKARRGEKVTFT